VLLEQPDPMLEDEGFLLELSRGIPVISRRSAIGTPTTADEQGTELGDGGSIASQSVMSHHAVREGTDRATPALSRKCQPT
jgi:hypothetical protein